VNFYESLETIDMEEFGFLTHIKLDERGEEENNKHESKQKGTRIGKKREQRGRTDA
jgi:hypothetical protein